MLALVNNEAHPFILGLRYAFHTPAKLYYVLNFCNGGDLYYLLSRCKKFKEAQARFYASEVFLALQARPAAPPSPRPRPKLAPTKSDLVRSRRGSTCTSWASSTET